MSILFLMKQRDLNSILQSKSSIQREHTIFQQSTNRYEAIKMTKLHTNNFPYILNLTSEQISLPETISLEKENTVLLFIYYQAAQLWYQPEELVLQATFLNN